ncbi:MAG TPA: hypothetical protein VN577_10495 [Terriglobales bacterium]|nr:hypothetical protein [Terriglobales bacterium]
MKIYRSILFFCLVTFLSTVLAFAADKQDYTNHASITFDRPITIGNTQLQPQTYTLRWNDTGNTTDVHFFDGHKEVASAPAHINKVNKSQEDGFTLDNVATKPQLENVFSKHETLVFKGVSGSNSGM